MRLEFNAKAQRGKGAKAQRRKACIFLFELSRTTKTRLLLAVTALTSLLAALLPGAFALMPCLELQPYSGPGLYPRHPQNSR